MNTEKIFKPISYFTGSLLFILLCIGIYYLIKLISWSIHIMNPQITAIMSILFIFGILATWIIAGAIRTYAEHQGKEIIFEEKLRVYEAIVVCFDTQHKNANEVSVEKLMERATVGTETKLLLVGNNNVVKQYLKVINLIGMAGDNLSDLSAAIDQLVRYMRQDLKQSSAGITHSELLSLVNIKGKNRGSV